MIVLRIHLLKERMFALIVKIIRVGGLPRIYHIKRPDELTSGHRNLTGNELLIKVESGFHRELLY